MSKLLLSGIRMMELKDFNAFNNKLRIKLDMSTLTSTLIQLEDFESSTLGIAIESTEMRNREA